MLESELLSQGSLEALQDLPPAQHVFDLKPESPIQRKAAKAKAKAAIAPAILDDPAADVGDDFGLVGALESIIAEDEEGGDGLDDSDDVGGVASADRARVLREAERRQTTIARSVSAEEVDAAMRRVYHSYAEDEEGAADAERAPTEVEH